MKNNYIKGFTYQEFAPQLTSELFDPEEWATNFVKAGAKFVLPDLECYLFFHLDRDVQIAAVKWLGA